MKEHYSRDVRYTGTVLVPVSNIFQTERYNNFA